MLFVTLYKVFSLPSSDTQCRVLFFFLWMCDSKLNPPNDH